VDPGYHVRPARPGEGPRLNDVEQRAGELFDGLDHLFSNDVDDNFPLDELEELIGAGMVWVACTSDDVPVGFLALILLDGSPHIEELDVHPDHQRRGLGRALIEAARLWAREHGATAVTLSTFRSVPWNAPYYARVGFEIVPEDQLSPAFHDLREAESRKGLPSAARVIMRSPAEAA
jgi:GNAT superfamily N-acetyltransferase